MPLGGKRYFMGRPKGSHNKPGSKLCRRWRKTILEAIGLAKGVDEACRLAGIQNGTIYSALKNDPEFREQWYKAMDDSVIILEAEAYRRASKYSDFLLWKLLTARTKGKYGVDTGAAGRTDEPTKVELNITVKDPNQGSIT